MTARMPAGIETVSARFSRLRATQAGLSRSALDQFDAGPVADAAELLADARVAAIVWNGTSGAWLGFEADEALCGAVTTRAGVPASTSVLAFRAWFRRRGVERVGLVTPHAGDVRARIQENWRADGIDGSRERRLDFSETFAFVQATEVEM